MECSDWDEIWIKGMGLNNKCGEEQSWGSCIEINQGGLGKDNKAEFYVGNGENVMFWIDLGVAVGG